MNDSTQGIVKNYIEEIGICIAKTEFDKLEKIIDILIEAKDNHATVYTAGNGGSAATASHICNDLLKGCSVCGQNGFKAECLADSLAVVTCLANDFDYDSIFTIQLKTKGKRGDVFIAYSGSGNSENIIKAAVLAKKMVLKVIGFTGRDGGRLVSVCDIAIIAPTDSMEQIEDLHMMYVHTLSDAIQKILSNRYSAFNV